MTDNVILEADATGSVVAEYNQTPELYGEIVSQDRSGVTSFYHFDGLGSTRALTDASEVTTDTASYSAFGEVVASSGTTVNPFGYVGALGYYTNGDTGDLYVRARVYQPAVGRWLSRDPLLLVDDLNLNVHVLHIPQLKIDDLLAIARRLSLTSNEALRAYSYCSNAPINSVDPTGLVYESCKPLRQRCTSTKRLRFGLILITVCR